MQRALSSIQLGLLINYFGVTQAFPSPAQWDALNNTLQGSLAHVHPPANPCHQASYDSSLCAVAKENWTNSTWRSDQIGAEQSMVWEQLNGHWCAIGNLNSTSPLSAPCSQGDVPQFGIRVTDSSQVQKAVAFAKLHGMRLSVKSTGHDYLGRSMDPQNLLVWTHLMKNITIGTSSVCGKSYDSLVVGAGVQWGEAYKALGLAGRVVPGGADPDVGASGGQVMGGGHSPLSNTYGLTPDSVISFKIVTMDGQIRTASHCENSDLFWALRGGGGGTYGIVTETTYQTYPDSEIVVAGFNTTITDEAYPLALTIVANFSSALVDAGWSGYVFNEGPLFFCIIFLPLIDNRTFDGANATFQAFFEPISKVNGVQVQLSEILMAPSFAVASQIALTAGATGDAPVLGSRLIPKQLLEDATSRKTIVDAVSSVRSMQTVPVVLVHLVAGGAPVSTPSDTAILPAWRTACWHLVVVSELKENATAQEIDSNFAFVTQRLTEPLRKVTPGSGAYMNEADPRAPDWKADFFGAHYDRLLTIKKKYDPTGLLKCNRCVGSDV